MPLCVICGSPLTCTHVDKHQDPVEKPCALKKGALWVHVMDDLGASVKGIEVDVRGQKKSTEDSGFARFDPLEAEKYTATLSPLGGEPAKAYDLPAKTTGDVWLAQGEVAYLAFQLKRKAKLKVKVVKASDKSTYTAAATVTVTGPGDPGDKPTASGIADYGVVSASAYSAKVVLDDKKTFYPPDAAASVTLAPGDDTTFPIELSPLARPSVKVVWSGGVIKDVGVVLKKGGDTDLGKSVDVTGLADFPVGGTGLRGGDHEVTLAFDDKVYMPSWSTPSLVWAIAEGSTETKIVTLIKLARPSVVVVWGTGTETPIEDVGVKLKKGGTEHDLGKSAKKTGLTTLAGGTRGVEPNAEHEVLLDFDKNVYMLPAVAQTLTFDEDFTGTKKVKLVKLARPTIKVVEKTSGQPVEGVDVKLTAVAGAKEFVHDRTGKGGGTVIADGKPRLPPGAYTITVAKTNLVQEPTAQVTFAEGSLETVTVLVSSAKGVLRVKVNRHDGKALPERVTFKLAKESAPTTFIATETTAAREVEVEKVEGSAKRTVKVRDDWKEVSLDAPETYVLTIPDLENAVLKKQEVGQVWAIGPSNKGKVEVKVKVEPTQTAELSFTLSKYKKVQFIAYNVKPGYKVGHRCPICFKQYDAPGSCTNGHASTAVKSKRCYKCGDVYDAGTTECAKCGLDRAYWCSTCNAARDRLGKCGCGAWILCRCAKCTTVGAFPMRCPHGACAGALSLWCQGPCNKLILPGDVNDAGKCTTCSTLVLNYWCTTCNKATQVPGRCPTSTCKNPVYGEQIYLGLADNHADLLARCLALKSAIKTAKGKESTDDDVLKVFMGPEFYFRGKDGAYPLADLSLIVEQLRKETRKPDYKDWLFVHGTAIGYLAQGGPAGVTYKLKVVAGVTGAKIRLTHQDSRVTVLDKIPVGNEQLSLGQWKVNLGGDVVVKAVTPVDRDTYEVELASSVTVAKDDVCTVIEPTASEIFNVALVDKGGSDEGVAGLHDGLVYKESISSIDFLRNNGFSFALADRKIYLHDQHDLALPTEGAGGPLARKTNPTSGEATKTGLGGGSVFTVDGVTFGLEVCLDHLEKRLNTYASAPPAGTSKVQVHLIPSWGMSIKPDSLAGVVGTQVFNVDGPDGSDAATVTKLSPAGTWARLAKPASHAVPDAPKEDVKYMRIDPAKPAEPAKETEIKDLEGKFSELTVTHTHKVIGADSGKGAGYAWVDLYLPADIPTAETS